MTSDAWLCLATVAFLGAEASGTPSRRGAVLDSEKLADVGTEPPPLDDDESNEGESSSGYAGRIVTGAAVSPIPGPIDNIPQLVRYDNGRGKAPPRFPPKSGYASGFITLTYESTPPNLTYDDTPVLVPYYNNHGRGEPPMNFPPESGCGSNVITGTSESTPPKFTYSDIPQLVHYDNHDGREYPSPTFPTKSGYASRIFTGTALHSPQITKYKSNKYPNPVFLINNEEIPTPFTFPTLDISGAVLDSEELADVRTEPPPLDDDESNEGESSSEEEEKTHRAHVELSSDCVETGSSVPPQRGLIIPGDHLSHNYPQYSQTPAVFDQRLITQRLLTEVNIILQRLKYSNRDLYNIFSFLKRGGLEDAPIVSILLLLLKSGNTENTPKGQYLTRAFLNFLLQAEFLGHYTPGFFAEVPRLVRLLKALQNSGETESFFGGRTQFNTLSNLLENAIRTGGFFPGFIGGFKKFSPTDIAQFPYSEFHGGNFPPPKHQGNYGVVPNYRDTKRSHFYPTFSANYREPPPHPPTYSFNQHPGKFPPNTPKLPVSSSINFLNNNRPKFSSGTPYMKTPYTMVMFPSDLSVIFGFTNILNSAINREDGLIDIFGGKAEVEVIMKILLKAKLKGFLDLDEIGILIDFLDIAIEKGAAFLQPNEADFINYLRKVLRIRKEIGNEPHGPRSILLQLPDGRQMFVPKEDIPRRFRYSFLVSKLYEY